MTRPNFIEAEAIQRAITWAEVTGGRLYIVHMSTAQGTDLVKAAQARGVDVYAETCAQYLVLDDSAFDGPDGHLFACCPQIKKKKRPGAALEGPAGRARSRSSRPTPAPSAGPRRRAGRATGPRSRWACPAWRRCCRSSTPTACSAGRLTPAEFVAKCCTNPAKLMGLYPAEGRHRRRAATPTSRSSTPRSGSRSITRRWKPTPTGAPTRAGRWPVSPRPRSAAAGRSSPITSSSARAAGAAGCRASGRDRSMTGSARAAAMSVCHGFDRRSRDRPLDRSPATGVAHVPGR